MVSSSLPIVPAEVAKITFVHQGSHSGDAGSVPPALQEALVNMRKTLLKTFPVQDALDYLQSRRADRRRLCVATFLQKVLVKADTRERHASQADHVTSYLTGVSVFTVRKFAGRGMASDGQVNVTVPMGGGGRPRVREEPDVGTANGLPAFEEDLEAFEADGGVEEPQGGRAAVLNEARASSSTAVATSRASAREAGLRLGSLVAPLFHS